MIGQAQVSFGSRADEWPRERIAKLDRDEIEQLRANALTLGESGIAELCDAVLATRVEHRRGPTGTRAKAKRLVSRSAAFEARGVYLQNVRTSWGGVRRSDGIVVFGIWADAVKSRDGGCACLLWQPNAGSHPWSDSPAGRERLKHCELAIAGVNAEGLLVYGERLEGHAPEEKARSIHGVDPQTVVHLRVVKHGEEYWAVWGARANARLAIAPAPG
jgi:hypothetical protein